MKALFLSELYRLRTLTLICFVLFFLILLGKYQQQGIVQLSSSTITLMWHLPMLAAFIFSLVQLSHYKNISLWTYLIHRPLPLEQILASLFLAGASLLTLVFILPVALIYAAVDISNSEFFEPRYYLLVPGIWSFVINFYLAGMIAALYGKKIALTLFFIPLIWFFGFTDPQYLLLANAFLFVLLLCLCKCVIRSDIDNREISGSKGLVFNLGLQPALYIALNVLLYLAMTIFSGPDRSRVQKNNLGFHNLANQSPSSQVFEKVLAQLPGLEKVKLLSQVRKAEVKEMHVLHPISGKTHLGQSHLFDRLNHLSDEDTENLWIFSHQSRQFESLTPQSKAEIINFSENKQAAQFQTVPYARGNWIYGTDQLWLFDSRQQQISKKLILGDNQTITSPFIPVFSSLWLATNSHLQIFSADAGTKVGLMSANAKIPLPKPYSELRELHVAKLPDAYLAILIYGNNKFSLPLLRKEEALAQGAVVIRVELEGKVSQLGTVNLDNEFSPWYLWSNYLISPVLAYFNSEFQVSKGNISTNQMVPQDVWVFSGFYLSCCLLIAWLMLRNSHLSVAEKWLWWLISGFGALPGLICLRYMIKTASPGKVLQTLTLRRSMQPG